MPPGLVLAALMLMMSCAVIHKIAIDPAAPKEGRAVVLFGQGINMNIFNGVDVKEAWYGKTLWPNESVRVTVPAGESEAEYDLNHVEGSGQSSPEFGSPGGCSAPLHALSGSAGP